MGLARRAEAAVPAGGAPGEDDVISLFHGGDALAHLLDDTGPLVAQKIRELVAYFPKLVVQIGMANTARLDFHQHLARPGRIQNNVL